MTPQNAPATATLNHALVSCAIRLHAANLKIFQHHADLHLSLTSQTEFTLDARIHSADALLPAINPAIFPLDSLRAREVATVASR